MTELEYTKAALAVMWDILESNDLADSYRGGPFRDLVDDKLKGNIILKAIDGYKFGVWPKELTGLEL